MFTGLPARWVEQRRSVVSFGPRVWSIRQGQSLGGRAVVGRSRGAAGKAMDWRSPRRFVAGLLAAALGGAGWAPEPRRAVAARQRGQRTATGPRGPLPAARARPAARKRAAQRLARQADPRLRRQRLPPGRVRLPGLRVRRPRRQRGDRPDQPDDLAGRQLLGRGHVLRTRRHLLPTRPPATTRTRPT